MKKLLIATGISITLSFTGVASALAIADSGQTQLSNVITRGTQEINRRLTTLNTLSSKINSATRVTSADKDALHKEVSAEISSLTELRTKLAAETTLTAARTDARSIVTEYRVYALIVPKAQIIRLADSVLQSNSKLSALAQKLQTRITDAKKAGEDVAALQNQLDTMNESITEANITANSVQAKAIQLQPTDYNSDHTILGGYRDQLHAAHLQNVAALATARTIVDGLKSL